MAPQRYRPTSIGLSFLNLIECFIDRIFLNGRHCFCSNLLCRTLSQKKEKKNTKLIGMEIGHCLSSGECKRWYTSSGYAPAAPQAGTPLRCAYPGDTPNAEKRCKEG